MQGWGFSIQVAWAPAADKVDKTLTTKEARSHLWGQALAIPGCPTTGSLAQWVVGRGAHSLHQVLQTETG